MKPYPHQSQCLRDHDVFVAIQLAMELVGKLTPFVSRYGHPAHADCRLVVDFDCVAIAGSQRREIMRVRGLPVTLHEIGYGDIIQQAGDFII